MIRRHYGVLLWRLAATGEMSAGLPPEADIRRACIDLQDSGGAQPLRSASTFNMAARTKTTVNNVAHIVVAPPLTDKLDVLHQMQHADRDNNPRTDSAGNIRNCSTRGDIRTHKDIRTRTARSHGSKDSCSRDSHTRSSFSVSARRRKGAASTRRLPDRLDPSVKNAISASTHRGA